VSLAWLVLGGLAQPAIGQGTEPTRFNQVATVGALLWLVLLAAILALRAWRSGGQHAA